MFTVDDYIRSMKATLEKQSNVLVSNLTRIFTYNFSTEIELLDFTIFIEPTRFELSIRMFSMDKAANEVLGEGKDTTVFVGSEDVLPEVSYYHLDDNKIEDFFQFYEQHEVELELQEKKAFIDWFRHCWKEAGGASLSLHSYIVFHDDDQSYDLKNDKWMDDEDKWS